MSLRLVAIIAFFQSCLVFGTNIVSPNIDYQIHSFNDLRELPQLLLKGARRFKFDPHYVSNKNVCGSSTECLLLNHDVPVAGGTYNSSTELVTFLGTNEFKVLSKDEKVSVALCFKSAPDKCKYTSAFNRWLALADEFFELARSASPQVEFVLDGDAKPVDCLLGRWLPWNAVWINGDSPADGFTSSSSSLDLYRYQILNNRENFSNWEWMAMPDVNYGKFSKGTYAYQLWEPDSQSDFRRYISIYRSGELHPSGLDFAINIDMAMFWVYTSGDQADDETSLTAPAVNTLLDPEAVAQGTHADSEPLVAAVTSSSSSSSSASNVVVAAFTRDATSVHVSVVDQGSSVREVKPGSSVPLSAAASSWLLSNSSMLVKVVSVPGAVLFVSSSANVVSVPVLDSSGAVSLDVTAAQLLILPSTVAQDLSAKIVDVSVSDSSTLLITSLSVKSNAFVLSTVYLNKGQGLRNSILAPTLVASVPAPVAASSIFRSRVVLLSASSVLLFFSSNAASDTVYGAKVDIPSPAATRWVPLTTGRYFDIDLVRSSRVSALMLVSDYGYCFNSHSHNTRSLPSVCSSNPTPTEHVLDYNVGLLEDWVNVLQSESCVLSISSSPAVSPLQASSCRVLNSCHNRILHGSFDQGSRPAVALSASSDASSLRFVEVHEGLPSSAVVSDGCGEPLRRDGLVVDSFDIDPWISNLVGSYDKDARLNVGK